MAFKLPVVSQFRDHEFPRLVCVETTNHCNAKCVFCPNNALARDKGPMSQDLFEKIIEDCREFPLAAIEPFMQGDPFSDPDILPRLEHINSRLPDTKLRLYTNGYAMTPKRIDAMGELNIDHLYISVNTLDPERYEAIMGLKLKRTMDNLDYLTRPERKNKIARKISFRMTRMPDSSLQEQDEFLDYCKDKGVRPMISGLFNYKGDINSELPVPSYGCEHVTRVDILASGKVTLCCMDQDGDYSWGDVNNNSVLQVYRGAIAARYRSMHAKGQRKDIAPCGTCNLFWPDLRTGSAFRSVKVAAEFGMYLMRNKPTGRKAPQVKPPASSKSLPIV